ncbi:hypothetical protein KSS87_007612, partial [Heliosperma pusillum]
MARSQTAERGHQHQPPSREQPTSTARTPFSKSSSTVTPLQTKVTGGETRADDRGDGLAGKGGSFGREWWQQKATARLNPNRHKPATYTSTRNQQTTATGGQAGVVGQRRRPEVVAAAIAAVWRDYAAEQAVSMLLLHPVFPARQLYELLRPKGDRNSPSSPEEQRLIIKGLIDKAESNLKEGNLYYVVSYRIVVVSPTIDSPGWFASWQKYTGLDENGDVMSADSLDLPNTHDRPGPIDNSGLVSHLIYSEPGSPELIRTLEEGRDYVLVPEGVWNKLLEWYKGGPPLPRRLILQGSIHKKFNIEVYPLTLRLIDSRDNSETVIRISKKATICQLHEKVGSLKGLPQNKVCIWDFFNNKKNLILDSSVKTLEDANLEMDQHKVYVYVQKVYFDDHIFDAKK